MAVRSLHRGPMSTLAPPAASPDDAAAFPADAIEVGRVIGAWGVKGAFRVQPHATDPQALIASRRWFIKPPAGPGRTLPSLLRITQAREHGSAVVASAQEVVDRDAAQGLTGAYVYVARSSFPSAAPDEYYWVDLIGMAVINRDGIALGAVTDLIDTGVHSVLRVRRPDAPADASPEAAERLIPFVAAYIDTVDLAARQIRVDWGLDY
jgi:16S rRNA processing protein RimM